MLQYYINMFAVLFHYLFLKEIKCDNMPELELELEFYLFDRQLHNIGEIISKKCVK